MKQIPIDKTIFQYVANFFARIEYVIDDVNGNSREAKVDASDRMNEIIRDLLEKMQSHGVKSFLEKKDEIPGLGSEQIDQECVVEKTREYRQSGKNANFGNFRTYEYLYRKIMFRGLKNSAGDFSHSQPITF